MHIVKLMGGLGNQMFQAAFARAITHINNTDVKLDLSWFDEIKGHNGITQRVYELGMFIGDFKFATPDEVQKCIHMQKVKNSLLPKFIRKLLHIPKYKNVSDIIKETKPLIYDKNLLIPYPNAYYVGYFQTEKYFAHLRPEILDMFSLKIPLNVANKKLLIQIKSVNSVSLHVRRGDYVKLQHIHGLCSLDYYKHAIEYIAKQVENPHFFLFSDDIDWVIKNLKIDYPYTVVDINDTATGIFDMELMKNCKHNIIANSSFSWWGAWMNNNPDKIVIAPKQWAPQTNTRYNPENDMLPISWIKL